MWDSVEEGFWFADNTTALWRTVNHIVGKEQPIMVTLKLEPNRYVKKEKGGVKESIMGFPISYKDLIVDDITWGKPTTLDEDGRLFLREKYKSNSQVTNLQFDFTHRRYTISYVTWGDVLAKIGGLRAVIEPFVAFFVPLLTLTFLMALMKIIQR